MRRGFKISSSSLLNKVIMPVLLSLTNAIRFRLIVSGFFSAFFSLSELSEVPSTGFIHFLNKIWFKGVKMYIVAIIMTCARHTRWLIKEDYRALPSDS